MNVAQDQDNSAASKNIIIFLLMVKSPGGAWDVFAGGGRFFVRRWPLTLPENQRGSQA
jgi:hypothetical protein